MIVLASASPRRKEILEQIIDEKDFIVVPSHFDESQIHEKDINKLCLYEARKKGESVCKKYNGADDVVISCDTMVYFNNEQLGKPKDEKDAKRMLETLSGNIHGVVSAYNIFICGKEVKHRICKARVFIEKLSDYEIDQYIESASPFDKAGGYGIQDKEYINCRVISGSYYTVLGLPKEDLEDDLINLGVI